MPELLSVEEAKALTSEYHEMWSAAHHHAWDLWTDRFANDPEFLKPMEPGDRATIVHRHIVDYVRRHIDGVCSWTDKLGFFLQILGEDAQAVVRFKYLNSALRPKNHPSTQQDLLADQAWAPDMLAAAGLSYPPTKLDVGYTLTPIGEALSRLVVVCNYGKDQPYHYNIDSEAGAVASTFPGPTMAPPAPRVISKRGERAPADSER